MPSAAKRAKANYERGSESKAGKRTAKSLSKAHARGRKVRSGVAKSETMGRSTKRKVSRSTKAKANKAYRKHVRTSLKAGIRQKARAAGKSVSKGQVKKRAARQLRALKKGK